MPNNLVTELQDYIDSKLPEDPLSRKDVAEDLISYLEDVRDEAQEDIDNEDDFDPDEAEDVEDENEQDEEDEPDPKGKE